MTYYVFDKQGRQTAMFKSGQVTKMSADCIQIECPPELKRIAKASGKIIR